MNLLTRADNILYFDIETSHCLAYVWGCGKQYVSANQIKKERKILSICYMWEGETKVHALKFDLKKHKINSFDDDADKQMLIDFMKVYNKASLVVAHNGRKFDISRMRARLVKYGLPDIPITLVDDSYTISKHIDFTSHKLDYIGKYLGVGRKGRTDLDLWIRIMEGDKKALDSMVAYNKQDVLLLAEIYRKVRPYVKSKLNLSVTRNAPNGCPSCGSTNLKHKDWVFKSPLMKKERVICQDCGKQSVYGHNLVKDTANYLR